MNNDKQNPWSQNANMTDSKKIKTKVQMFMHRQTRLGVRFSLSADDLANWIELHGHTEFVLQRSGMNGIQPLDPSAPLSLDNIQFDPKNACRQRSKCAGVKKVEHLKEYSGGNYRDGDNYRLLRVDEWIAELRLAKVGINKT